MTLCNATAMSFLVLRDAVVCVPFFAWFKASLIWLLPWNHHWYFSVIPSQQWLPWTKSGTQSKKRCRRHTWIKLWRCPVSKYFATTLSFSEITGNIAPPRNLNCLNIVNLYGSQHNRNFRLKKYHKSPPSWQVPLSIAVYFPSQKNSKQFCFFHVVFLSSLSSPAPWAPLLELPLSSAAEAEDHVLWRLSNFNLEKSKNSKLHVLKTKMWKCTVHWKRTCSIVLWNKWMPNVAPGAMGFQVNSNSWVWVRFFHIRPWRSISATSRAMFLESSKPQWGLRQWKR